MRISYIVSALAAAGSAAAQCSAATKTIQNSGDASQLASCQTFTGNIVIATQTTDDINLSGIQTLKGDLTVVNVNDMSTLGADSLQTIQGTFKMKGVRGLSTLSFPQLSSVTTIDWATLPKLSGLDFSTGVDHASSVSITDTQLANLDGISLQTVDSLVLISNTILKKVDLDLTHFTTELSLSANGANLELSMPNLQFGKDFTLQNIGSLSVPSLQSVNGTLNILDSQMKSIDAPKLTTVGSTLKIFKNTLLSELSMDKLSTVNGGFVIGSCPELKKIDGLSSLTKIDGNLDFSGAFDEVDLPKLSLVTGAFNMQSSGDISSTCDAFDKKHGRALPIRGKYVCTSTNNPHGLGTDPTGSGSDTSSGSGSGGEGAASGFFPSLISVAAAAGVAALAGVF